MTPPKERHQTDREAAGVAAPFLQKVRPENRGFEQKVRPEKGCFRQKVRPEKNAKNGMQVWQVWTGIVPGKLFAGYAG